NATVSNAGRDHDCTLDCREQAGGAFVRWTQVWAGAGDARERGGSGNGVMGNTATTGKTGADQPCGSYWSSAESALCRGGSVILAVRCAALAAELGHLCSPVPRMWINGLCIGVKARGPSRCDPTS